MADVELGLSGFERKENKSLVIRESDDENSEFWWKSQSLDVGPDWSIT